MARTLVMTEPPSLLVLLLLCTTEDVREIDIAGATAV
jgi:hypothetical protein